MTEKMRTNTMYCPLYGMPDPMGGTQTAWFECPSYTMVYDPEQCATTSCCTVASPTAGCKQAFRGPHRGQLHKYRLMKEDIKVLADKDPCPVLFNPKHHSVSRGRQSIRIVNIPGKDNPFDKQLVLSPTKTRNVRFWVLEFKDGDTPPNWHRFRVGFHLDPGLAVTDPVNVTIPDNRIDTDGTHDSWEVELDNPEAAGKLVTFSILMEKWT